MRLVARLALMNIVIVGKGNLAQAIAKRCRKEKVSHSYWEKRRVNRNSVILYCGSERLFKEVWEFCSANKTPLLLLSTNISYSKKASFPFRFIPNASLEIREFIKTVMDFATNTPYTKVSILESHQKAKKDMSGTARHLAELLGESSKIIKSIRDPKTQLKLGIPKKYLDGHAYHKITFTYSGLSIDFSVLVLGRETYAKGALTLARKLG